MRKTSKNYEVESLVFRLFLKCVKKHGLYNQFRCSVNVNTQDTQNDLFHKINYRSNGNYRNSLSRLGSIGSPFMGCRNHKEFLAVLNNSNGGRLMVENTSECQMKLMNMVNFIIHSCIEYSVYDHFEILENLGEETYNEVCKALFGKEFVDKTSELMTKEQENMLRMIPPELRERFSRNGELQFDNRKFLEFLQHLERNRRNIVMPPPPQNSDFYYPFGDEYDDFDVEDWID